MKKILICASRISHILNFHLPYIEHFKDMGYEVHVAAQGTADHPLIDHCYDLMFVKNPLSLRNAKTIKSLKKLMRENRYDLVYSNSTLAGAAARMAVRGLGKDRPRCIHISHGYMFDRKKGLRSTVYRTAEKLSAGVTDILVVMNDEDMKLAERYRLGRSLYFTNGMGLCTDRFPPISDDTRRLTRSRFGAVDTTAVFLCVGEFSSRKNQTLLIEAFNKMHSRHKDSVLILAGSGKTQDECRELVSRYELEPWVRFVGHTKDVNTLYRSCDVLVSAAKMEGLPFNLMEALYCGIPSVVSDIKGHTDLVENEKNGLIFPIDCSAPAEAAAGAMLRIAEDRELYRKLSSNASLDPKYYIENVRPQLLKVLDGSFDQSQIKSPEVTYQ